jgi:type I restriction enzyme S subunit
VTIRTTLGEVIEIFDKRRVPLNSQERAARQGPFPYYGAQGIIDYMDGYLFDGRYLLVPEDGENLNSRKLPIAFFATGQFWVNNHAHILLGKTGCLDTDYLSYWLNNADIAGYVTGAAQPKLSQGNLCRIEIDLPPIEAQVAVARFLRSYDDLIENNTRRIAILAEMARRLFEEWFVHFRAPGCQGLALVESPIGPVPQGWEVVPLEILCSRITDGAHYSPPTVAEGCPMLSVKDMRTWGFDFSECRSISQADFDNLVRNDCRPLKGDILVAKDGANLNKHTFLIEDDLDAVLLSSIAILRPIPSFEKEFLVAALKSEEVSLRIKSSRSGAAIPRIILKDFCRLPLLLPPSDLRRRFETIAEPVHKLCRELSKSNANLLVQRDLILPKLISGEIDIGGTSTFLREAAE